MLDGIVEQRERAEAEEVHLEQADPLDLLHRPLRRNLAVVLLAAVERHEFGQRSRGDHHAGRVHRGVARHAFEPPGDASRRSRTRSSFCSRSASAGISVDRRVERHVERAGNQLRHAVDFGNGHLHDAAHVSHRRLGLHGPERDDLRHVLAAVLLGDVGDHLAATPFAEVDVDIWQRHAVGIQEPLEVQVEVQRIDVRDPKAVGHEAADRRTAAGAHGNPPLAGVAHEVPDDQEIALVVHAADDADLERQAGLVVGHDSPQLAPCVHRAPVRQAFGETLAHHVLEVRVGRIAVGHGEVWQVRFALGQIHVAPLGDPHGVRERVRIVAEHPPHFVWCLQEELVAVVLQALFVADTLPRADAEQNVVRVLIRLTQVVHVVRAHKRHAEVARDGQQARVDLGLLRHALVLHLEEEVAGAEQIPIGRGGLYCPLRLVRPNPGRDFAFQAAAEPNQPLRVRREDVFVDARLVIEPLRVPGRDELDEVVEPFVRLGQEHQMVGRLAGDPRPLLAPARRHVHLTPENGIDAALPGLVVEGDRGEHVAVLGHGHGRHLQFGGAIEHLADAARAVEQREFGMQVQVNELSHRCASSVIDGEWGPTPTRRSAPLRGPRDLYHCGGLRPPHPYSHSIVAGGFELMS